jgi:VWFA-related protein
VNFLARVLGPHDLFWFLTSRNTAKDLVLGQKTTAVEAQIDDLVRAENMDRDEADDLDRCTWPGEHRGGRVFDPSILKALSRADALYNALEGLVSQLGSLRQERKNVILVSNRLSRARPRSSLVDEAGVAPPRIGITNGRIGIGTRDNPTVANDSYCSGELLRLASIDFDVRYRQLLRDARDANVAFYPVMPAGLQAQSGGAPGSSAPVDDLISLAHETDGIPAVNTNDLDTGMRKIADDLGAYYLLGYYTTNTNWDGGIRTITVKLKSSGASVRARREYRAPTQAEMAALASAATAKPAEPAPPHASLIGEPTVYTLALHAPPKAVATRQFARTDRLRIEWPILAEADNRQARILDSAGKPLPIDLPLSEAGGKLATELPLAPFARGDYQIELTATAATGTDRKVVTIMIR